MKAIRFIFAIVMVLSMLNIIDANEKKQRSTNLFRDRLLDLLLEAKRQQVLYNKYKESEKDIERPDDSSVNEESDEERFGRTLVRRKVVGISDNPF